ncbi:Hypothetical predicted protein [Mytilus galloprovincialis]|uniref:Uncharacterized protein n=1 Tax=Mytilus galloprovincialis TaxID=29158 RepID=A0A8B6C3C8_MYTGA|nr:Hypothetical predicted protein [Mytilus galloprovincialis]
MQVPNMILILVACVVSVQSITNHPPPRHLVPRVPPPHLLPPHLQHLLPPHLKQGPPHNSLPPHLLPPHLQPVAPHHPLPPHLLPPHLQQVPPHHPLPSHLQPLSPHKSLPPHLQPLPPHHPLPPHLQPVPPHHDQPLPPHQYLRHPQPIKAPQPAGRCVPPRDETVTKLRDVQLVGKYPAADISRYLRKSSRHFNRHVAQARRTASCHCNRHKAKSSHSSYGAPPPPPKHTSTQWVDTCPAVQNLFFFPKSTEFHGHHCWILRPWVRQSGGCPYVGCQQRSCLGVTAVSEHVFPGIKACRHTNFKTMVYYIWCPKLGQLIRQYKRLPQCCSCMVLRC